MNYSLGNMLSCGRRVAFNPLSLSPALWLSDTGSNSAQWDDLSGNGRHATQAIGANQPAIVTGALNGRQVRRFDGVNDTIGRTNTPLIGNIAGYTIFHVYSYRSLPNVNLGAFGIRYTGAATVFLDSKVAASSSYRTGYRRLTGDAFSFFDLGVAATGFSIKCHVMNFVGGVGQMLLNGSSLGTAAIPSGNTADVINDFWVGVNASGLSDFAPIDSAEILVFPTALSTENRRRIEGYLSSKYNIPLA